MSTSQRWRLERGGHEVGTGGFARGSVRARADPALPAGRRRGAAGPGVGRSAGPAASFAPLLATFLARGARLGGERHPPGSAAAFREPRPGGIGGSGPRGAPPIRRRPRAAERGGDRGRPRTRRPERIPSSRPRERRRGRRARERCEGRREPVRGREANSERRGARYRRKRREELGHGGDRPAASAARVAREARAAGWAGRR